MGKKIDGFVATLIPGFLIWLLLSSRMENRIMPLAAALIGCLIFGKLARKAFYALGKLRFFRKRHLRKNAGGALMRIASIPCEQAQREISALIRKCYPGSDFTPEIIQQHPALSLSESAVFQAWKKHAGEEKLVICASCRTEPSVRAFAAALHTPKISLIDSDMIAQMIAEFPEGMLPKSSKKHRMRLRHAANLLVNRKNAPRNLLFSASMLLMYLITNNVLYLFSALFLLAIAFLSLRRKLRPHKLF